MEIKFDLGTDPLTGRRLTRYRSFKGTKREAEAELTRLKAGADRGDHIDPSKTTLAQFLDRWEAWAATQVAAKTHERYLELAAHHVRPHLGNAPIQRLRTVSFAELYGKLQRPKPDGAGLAPRTVGHVHRLLHRQFGHAVKWGIISTNPLAAAEPPRVPHTEIDILTPTQIKMVLDALRGKPLYRVAVVALGTGMRRGELVALRWRDVDFDAGMIRVERSLEQTSAGLQFKQPKTKAGRRAVAIPKTIVAELREHWKEQQETRLALGIGRATDEDLVFPRPDAGPWPPDSLTTAWQKTVAAMKLPKVTFARASAHTRKSTHRRRA